MNECFTLTGTVFGIAAFCWLILFPFSQLRRDSFRTDIRQYRDDLFDFMWQNGYSYDNPSYCRIRQTLNGILRVTNWLSPLTFFIILAFSARDSSDAILIDEGDERLRSKLNQCWERAARRLVYFVFCEGVWGHVTMAVAFAFRSFAFFKRMKSRAFATADKSLRAAYASGAEFSRIHCG